MMTANNAHQKVTLRYQGDPKSLNIFNYFQFNVNESLTCSGKGGLVHRLTIVQIVVHMPKFTIACMAKGAIHNM